MRRFPGRTGSGRVPYTAVGRRPRTKTSCPDRSAEMVSQSLQLGAQLPVWIFGRRRILVLRAKFGLRWSPAPYHAERAKNIGLTAESDQYLADLVAQAGMRKLEIALDISTIRREDVNEASRVAKAWGVGMIRSY